MLTFYFFIFFIFFLSITRPSGTEIKHNVGAQKKYGQVQRYDVDHGAKLILTQELINGFVQIDKYMKKNSFPRLPLPSICGYIPLVDKFASTLKQKSNIVIPNHDHNI